MTVNQSQLAVEGEVREALFISGVHRGIDDIGQRLVHDTLLGLAVQHLPQSIIDDVEQSQSRTRMPAGEQTIVAAIGFRLMALMRGPAVEMTL